MQKDYKIHDHGYVKYIEHWGSDEMVISSARTSTNKGFLGWGPKHAEDCRFFPDSGPEFACTCTPKPGDEKLLKYLWKNKHLSCFDFAGLVIEMQAPIFVWRQVVRHRSLEIAAVNEMSARYAQLPNLNYIPTLERLMQNADGSNKQAGTIEGAKALTIETAGIYIDRLKDMYEEQEAFYQWALNNGIPKELARIHVGVSRYTRTRIQMTLRDALAFLELRLPDNAQEEIRDYANVVAKLIQQLFPKTYEVFSG